MIMRHNGQLKDFKDRGAVLNGGTSSDQSYTALVRQAAEYQMQFSEEESLALLGRAIEEKDQKK